MNVEIMDAHDRRAGATWRTLEKQNTCFFLSWQWIEHWISALPSTHTPMLAIFRRAGTPVAAAMFGRRRIVRHRVVPSRTWFLNATGDHRFDDVCVEHNGVIGERLPLPELVAALPKGWDELVLPGVNAEAFADLQVRGVRVHVDHEVPSHHVDLQRVRECPEGYLGLLGSKTRSQIRRSRRELGEVEVEIAAEVPHALDIFAELVTLHQAAWTAKGEPGAFGDPWIERFHRDLIHAHMPYVELVRVRARGKTVGCVYSFVYRGRVLCYQTGFSNYEDPNIKPGFVCHAAAVSNAASRGDLVYDFLGGDSRYKQSLATSSSPLRWLRVQRPLVRFALADQLREWKHALARD